MLDILGQKTDKKLDMKSAMKLDKISTMKSDKKSGKKKIVHAYDFHPSFLCKW